MYISGGSRGGAWGPQAPLILGKINCRRKKSRQGKQPPPPNSSRSGSATVTGVFQRKSNSITHGFYIKNLMVTG